MVGFGSLRDDGNDDLQKDIKGWKESVLIQNVQPLSKCIANHGFMAKQKIEEPFLCINNIYTRSKTRT
jgi:hypothetical protein